MRLGMEGDTDYDAFSAANGAVRNFRMQLSGPIGDMRDAVDGHFGGGLYFGDMYTANQLGEQVEFTFVPTGPLIDGTTGETFTRLLAGPDSQLMKGIPVGPYRISAEAIAPDGSRQTLMLKLSQGGQAAPAVDINWTGEGECNMGSGFEWVYVWSDHWNGAW